MFGRFLVSKHVRCVSVSLTQIVVRKPAHILWQGKAKGTCAENVTVIRELRRGSQVEECGR